MQYLVNVVYDRTTTATDAEMTAIDAFNDGLRERGAWVLAGGLAAPQHATVIDARGDGVPTVTEGPFVETAEFVAGFWVIEAPDDATALELATAGSHACHRKVEVRAFL
ncbi:hypothetical protein KIN34_05610 [Cellulomonas sp. DKR-3]|uniref:YCII-related domain-containing protein n=1 Tax=Cellulomonas fulva TaxID=2835530 RepID=A0ABS5TX76_9CELL|nr:YciI family protein [Cellulomonas fulva]MBT0993761.1 hypothetical protein [Cellulomonas fulva]